MPNLSKMRAREVRSAIKFHDALPKRKPPCEHPKMFGMWTVFGRPKMYCPDCFFVRPMTHEEKTQ